MGTRFIGATGIRKNISALGLFLLLIGTVWDTNAQDRTLQSAGDVLLVSLPVASLTGTLLIGDREGSWQFVKGFVVNQAVTLGMKYAINKPRPYDNGFRAFPSGHTSTTFQSAAFLQKRYGWKFGVPGYVLAAFTGYTRIKAHKHDGWDVLAGALVGIGSSYLFTSPYIEYPMELTFSSDGQGLLVGFNYTF
ncbi:phosphatase PAP2 family protein [Flagellimonas zhangzhouensis]|uniref:Membrane-associated phospholipid phosphatase n=1 Tax=Flagellimonas zhangzhouensis TaxID=1073328 RepID=A0A1H2YF74_9FLAO|nr:phosphatase PAP2 family protein [Allomuricauda zhangzhouensis]SDQ96367.1 Membrane-associated phospholipid phosphatase [Allomuricauda zhangzhouensis]SDX03625.1 Membrane-associated phospholipid phosphatase [Allomuricauda zhangzhouensis]